MPTWDSPNVEDHCDKHATCFTAIHNCTKSEFCIERYRVLSQQCHRSHWMKYKAVSWDSENECYRPRACYFVDEHPAVACTTLDEAKFLTYFHSHFGKRRCWIPSASVAPGDKKLKFLEWIGRADKGRLLLDLEVLKQIP